MAVTPALKRLVTIIEKGEDAQAPGAIKEVLARNDLYGSGVEPKGARSPAQAISVQTQVNLPEVHLASMSDQELETYQSLLLELRELLPAEEPKRIGSVSR